MGGVGVEGTRNCGREAFSPAFVPLSRCTLTFLSATAPVGSRHQTPYYLSVFLRALMGVQIIIIIIQHSPVLCSVESYLSSISDWHTQLFFFSGHILHQYSGQHFIAPSLTRLARGFVEARPPAGIREDNSGAFRWVFHWLLLPSSSRNIIGAVHFVPASLLCPVVTQSICLSISSFSLWEEACLSFVMALQFTPCTSKEIDFLSPSLAFL